MTQRRIEMRGDRLPNRLGFGGKQMVHGGGLLFTRTAAHFATNGIGGKVLRTSFDHTKEEALRKALAAAAETQPGVSSAA